MIADHTRAQSESLITQFPVEILSTIFTFAVDKNSFGDRTWSNANLIGMTCTRWRAVALSTPWIWASLSLNVHLYRTYDDKILRLLETHITRSQNRSFRIEISVSPRGSINEPHRIDPSALLLLGQVLVLARRFSHFRFQCTAGRYISPEFIDVVGTIFKTTSVMPILETMEIHMLTRRANIHSAWSDRLAAIEAPNLRSLTCRGSVFEKLPDLLVSVSLSFASLTTISMNVTPNIAGMLLRQTCPNLTSAHFVVLSPIDMRVFPLEMVGADSEHNEFDDADSDPQIVPCLRSLTLETSPSSWELERNSFRGIWKILQDMTCPELTSLALIADSTIRKYTPIHDRHFDIRPALLGFLERSQSSQRLESLWFERVPITDHYLTEVLKRVPRLRSLRVHEAKIDKITSTGDKEDYISKEPNHILTPTLFRVLTCSSSTCSTSETPMLLGLRKIVFVSQTDWPDHSLEEMIRSRVRGDCVPLESVVLKASDGMHHFRFPLIDSLRDEGLTVRVVATVYEGEEAEVLGYSGLNYWLLNDSGTQRRGLSGGIRYQDNSELSL
ncbi:hypothetical protein PM082_007245 [Marasmius tenuissimus]|nr:hypothetical protein PM082_007245 [Marasmius tenuissimus]